MDQTEKIVPQSKQTPSQNNPESQKGSKKLSSKEASYPAGQNQAQKSYGQKSSQNGSSAMSQTASQMDQQIMRGLSKKERRRYTTFLEVLGIDVKSKLSNKSEEPIQDGQNIDHQQLEPKPLAQEIRQPGQPYEEVIPFREAENQGEAILDGGNYSLSQKESKVKSKSRDLSQRSENGKQFQNLENRMEALENQPDVVLEPTIQAVIPSQPAFIDFQIQKIEEIQAPQSEPKPTRNPYQEVEIDKPSVYTQTNLKIQAYHQSEGEMSMDNNFDPLSNNKPFSDFSYDMINSIYTPVSLQKVPLQDPNAISFENDPNSHLGQQELAIVMEEFKQMISEEKDVEIDGPSIVSEYKNDQIHEPFRPNEVYQPENILPNRYFQSEHMNVEKDVEIDGSFEKPYFIQNKDVEIDGPSITEPYQNHDVEIDGPSDSYEAPPQTIQTIQSQGQYESTEPQQPNQETIQNHNPPSLEKSDKEKRSQLHIVQEVQNEDKMDLSMQNAVNNSEVRQNSFNMFNPSAKIFKTQSQNNEKPNSGFPRNKKSSQTSSFLNHDLIKTAEVHQNRRKFSESSRSAGLNSVNNKVSSHKRPNEYVQNNGSFILSQNIFDSRELNSFQETNQRIIEIEEQIEPHDSVKMTPNNNNSFSNRSEKQSIKSKRSNRFSDQLFNEKQVPPLDSLQLVRDGKEPRLERKSRSSQNSNRSRHSRSASTCKKSYDDLSEIHMQKIDQKGEQLEQKSIKRSLHRIYTPAFSVDEVQGQKNEVENELVQIHQHQTQEDVEIDGKHDEIHWNKHQGEKRNENYSMETSYNRLQQEKILTQRKDNFTQTVSHQITIHFDKQEVEEPIYESKSVQNSVISSASSIKTTESQKKRQKDEYLQSQRKKKMNNLRFVPVFEIHIENPLPIEQRIDNVLIFCKEYQAGNHHSNYERSKFKEILNKNFQFFGTELQPITDLGQRMLHDGIFACTFITFVKQNKNSGMLESLMFTQFEEQVGIRTNKDVFSKQLKRVKEEREMHYNNEFQIRLKQHEQRKANQEAKKMQMNKNVMNQTVLIEPKPQQSKVLIEKKERRQEEKKEKIYPKRNRTQINKFWQAQFIVEESNDSVAPSSQTMTVDEQRDFEKSAIKRKRIQDISPILSKPQIKETDSVFDSLGPESVDESQTFQVKEKNKPQTKKQDPPKKRITKKKEKKIVDIPPPVAVKSEYFQEESFEQTVSQVQQKSHSQRKQEKSVSLQKKDYQLLGQKPKVTKGILKSSRPNRNSQQQKQKKPKRSPSKKDLQKVSRKKKEEVSKDKATEKSNQKPGKSQKKGINTSPDNEQNNLSVTISPRNKVSFQKVVQEKVNQGKVVKFSQSTKGGESASHAKRRNPRMFEVLPEEEPQQETQPEQQSGKRTLRSRSKK